MSLTQQFVRECFDYDPGTGFLTWKVRPRSHFSSDQQWSAWTTRRAGRTAGGSKSSNGYWNIRLTVDGKTKSFLSHRLIWLHVYGYLPSSKEIDHRDGDPLNNRLLNLRLGTHAENRSNCVKETNATGFRGVFQNGNKYQSYIQVNGEKPYLGLFDTAKEAGNAYIEAAKFHRGEFSDRVVEHFSRAS